MINREQLKQGLIEAGIRSGSILSLQSSYKGTGGIDGGIDTLIDVFQEVLGPDGTLIMGAYNFKSWTEGHYFDNRETPSGVGAVAEIFRKREGVRRSRHPIHSLSVWGKLQDEICSLEYENSFGSDSVFAFLLKHNATYATIGLGLEQPFLPCHFTETEMKTPYRRTKNFSGLYVDEGGEVSLKTYGFDVRREEFLDQKAPIFQTHIWQFERGALSEHRIESSPFFHGTAKDYNQSLCELIEENPRMFGWV